MKKLIRLFVALSSFMLMVQAGKSSEASELQFRRIRGYLADSGDNVVVQSGRARLHYAFKQDGDKPIAMEAEMASGLVFEDGRGVMAADKDACGGLSVANVMEMTFEFEVVTSGTYTAWYRASFPRRGNWNHTESMDGGPLHQQVDSEGAILNQWIWIKGPAYKLNAGHHVWNFGPSGWMGGCAMDKVVLALGEDEPKGLGPSSLPSIRPLEGTVQTRPADPACLAQWVRMGTSNPTEHGTVTVEASVDGAVTWVPVDKEGWLKHLGTPKPLILQFTLKGTVEQPVPQIGSITLEYLIKPSPPIVLEDDRMRLSFSGETGALVDIVNKHTGASYMVEGAQGDFIAFSAINADPSGFGRMRSIPFAEFTFKGADRIDDGSGLVLKWSVRGGSILPSLTVHLEGGGIARMQLVVDNRSDLTIAKTMLPMFSGLRIGTDEKDDFLFTPANSGCILKYPARFQVPRRIFTRRRLAYPGNAWMCWMSLWDETGGGLYMACYDKKYRYTQLHFSASGEVKDVGGNEASVLPPEMADYPLADKPGSSVTLGFEKNQRIPAHGGVHQLPDVILGVHEGDWHWGADHYREWAESWMVKTPIPQWLRDLPGIANAHGGHVGFNYVDYYKGRPYSGARTWTLEDPPYPFVAFWAQMVGSETSWSRQPLHLYQGTAEQFTDAVQKHHERGHRVTAYILPTRMTPAHHRNALRIGAVPRVMYPDEDLPPEGFYARIGERGFDGRLRAPLDSLGEGAACLGNPEWRDYIAHWVLDKYMDDYGTDGMYLDGAGLYTKECADLDHGHDYGEWTRGACRLYKRLTLEGQARRPGAVFMGEGMSDVENRYLDLSLYYIDNAPEVYRYTFPENEGFMCGRVTSRGKDSIFELGYEDWFDFDTVFGLKTWGKDRYYEPPMRKPFEQTAAFREQIHQFQNRSRFVDNVGLSVSEPTVLAKLFVRDDARGRGALLVANNPKRKENVTATVAADQVGKAVTAWLVRYDTTWQRVPLVLSEGTYRVELPTDRLSAIYLLERCAPQIRIAQPKPTAPGERTVVEVMVRNLEDTPLKAQLTLRQPKDWQVDNLAVDLAPGQAQTYRVGYVPSLSTKPDVYDLTAVVSEIGGAQTIRCVPCGVCRPVLARLDWTAPDRIRLTLTSTVSRKIEGTVALAPPAPVTVVDNDRRFALSAGETTTIDFTLKDVDKVGTREDIKATIAYEDTFSVAHENVQPPLPNGNFELCLAGDGLPDYWNYETPRHGTFFKLDPTVKMQGDYSLRVEGSKKNGYTMVRNTSFRPRPATRYRMSVSIRRSKPTAGIFLKLYCNYGVEGSKQPYTYVELGKDKDAKADTWQTYTAEFDTPPVQCGWNVILTNHSKGEATAWFDDIRFEEIDNVETTTP